MNVSQDTINLVDTVPYYDVNIIWDSEAHMWVAIADDILLTLENKSFDTLIERVKAAASEILELNFKPYTNVQLRFIPERFVAVS